MKKLRENKGYQIIVKNEITLELVELLMEHLGFENCEVEEGCLLDNYSFFVEKRKKYDLSDRFESFLYNNVDYFALEDVIERFTKPNCDLINLKERFETSQSSGYTLTFEKAV